MILTWNFAEIMFLIYHWLLRDNFVNKDVDYTLRTVLNLYFIDKHFSRTIIYITNIELLNMTSIGQKTQTTNKMYKCDRNKRKYTRKKNGILTGSVRHLRKNTKKLTYKERMLTFIQIWTRKWTYVTDNRRLRNATPRKKTYEYFE